jgi:hypothetical protein
LGKTSVKAVNKYIAKAYDRINFVMPKGTKEEIKAYAESVGQSSGEWMRNAIKEKMQRQDAEFKESVTREKIEE